MRSCPHLPLRFAASLRTRLLAAGVVCCAVACYLFCQHQHGLLGMRRTTVILRMNGYVDAWLVGPGLLLRGLAAALVAGLLLAGPERCDRLLRGAVARLVASTLFFELLFYVIFRIVLVHDNPVPDLYLVCGAVVSAVLAWLAQRVPFASSVPRPSPRGGRLLAFAAGCAASMAGAALVLKWFPINVDSQSQIAQARLLNTGRFVLELPAALQHAVIFPYAVVGPREFAQFPPGYILPLALVQFLHLPLHTVDVLATGGIALCTVLLARALAPAAQRRTVAWLTLLFLCTAPQFLVMTGSMMNHTWTALLLMTATLCFLTAWRRLALGRTVGWLMFCGGVGLAWACATRPLTGAIHLAFWGALAVACMGWRVYCARSLRPAITLLRQMFPAALGMLPPLIVFSFYNYMTTGHLFTSGYAASDPVQHRLGFVPGPDGLPYTPLVALQNFVASALVLNANLACGFIGAATLLVVWWIRPTWRRGWLLLVALPVVQVAGYALYHFHDLFFGPRTYFEFVPLLTIAAALGVAPVLRRGSWASRVLVIALVILCVGGAVGGVEEWGDKLRVTVGRAEQFERFMRQNAHVRPACITIQPKIAELCGQYYLGEPGRPVWFIYADKAEAARRAPELQGCTWLDFGIL